MKDPRYSVEARNAKADAMLQLLDNGYFRIYSGIRPDTPDDAFDQNDSGAELLAELRFDPTMAFGAAAVGVATANSILGEDAALATGTAAWFRCLKSDGTSAILDGTVGASGVFDLVLNATAIVLGVPVDVTAFTYMEPASN